VVALWESAEDIARLQALLSYSAESAGPAMRRNFAHPDWCMSAEEFVVFWGTGRMANVATVARSGAVHAAPLEITLARGKLVIPTYSDSVRLKDHRANKRCVITAWDDAYTAAIVYGDAEVPDDAGSGLVTVEVTPTRIYAIRPPPGHHSLKA
jgi:hypothetical protein